MPDERIVDRVARALEPKAWAAIGKENDGTKHRDKRVASLKVARTCLAAFGLSEALERERRLREALEPFAELGRGEVAERFTDGTTWTLSNGERRLGFVRHGDLRRAAALNATSNTGTADDR